MISIICPVYNEAAHIDRLLSFLSEVQPADKEMFFVDGESKDDTAARISRYAAIKPGIYLISNPDRYVPFAMNLAIPRCKGEIIVRLDAHCDYAPDYFEQIVAVFRKTNADIVGGPTRTAFRNSFQHAVGNAITTKFGVGGSRVHQLDYEGETDSVTFGAWKKEIFSDVGLFDTRLQRNQDDEFHYRARSLGKKIYQSPAIKLYYYPRSDLRSLFSQYYQYGLYKPMVLRKVSSEIKIRHLIPSGFTLYLFLLLVLGWLYPAAAIFFLFYLSALLFFSFSNKLPAKARFQSMLVYPAIHLGYGIGFIKGLLWPPSGRGIPKNFSNFNK